VLSGRPKPSPEQRLLLIGLGKAVNTVPFDAAHRLEAAGFSREQAEAVVEAMAAVAGRDLATKQDIRELEHRLELLKRDLPIRLGGIVVAAAGVVVALDQLLG